MWKSIFVLSVVSTFPSFILHAQDSEIQIRSTYESVKRLLPHLSIDRFHNLIFERGSPSTDSNMTVEGLHAVLEKDTYLKVSDLGLINTRFHECRTIRHLNKSNRSYAHNFETYLLKGKWEKQEKEDKNRGNILGGYGRFYSSVQEGEMSLPVFDIAEHLDIAAEVLAFFGAELIREGECIRFYDEKLFPVWKMYIANHYVERWLYEDDAGGEYIEWHKDRPHWHHALKDTGGFYILGKALDEQYGNILLTGFKIPEGYAVYTYGGVIHSDAHLRGHWLVGYDESGDYSTVKVLNSKNAPLHLEL